MAKMAVLRVNQQGVLESSLIFCARSRPRPGGRARHSSATANSACLRPPSDVAFTGACGQYTQLSFK